MSKQFVPINGTKQYCLDGHPDRDKIIEEFKNECGNIVRRFTEERNTPRQFRLRPSNMGHPVRKLWFMANTPQPETEEQSHRPLMFLFGSLTEALLVCVAKLTGPRMGVEGRFSGVSGRREHHGREESNDVLSWNVYTHEVLRPQLPAAARLRTERDQVVQEESRAAEIHD